MVGWLLSGGRKNPGADAFLHFGRDIVVGKYFGVVREAKGFAVDEEVPDLLGGCGEEFIAATRGGRVFVPGLGALLKGVDGGLHFTDGLEVGGGFLRHDFAVEGIVAVVVRQRHYSVGAEGAGLKRIGSVKNFGSLAFWRMNF